MNNESSPKIPFYKVRSFSEKMDTSFAFVKENWKVILKYATYLLLPIALLQSFNMNKVTGLDTIEMQNALLENPESFMFGPEFSSYLITVSISSLIGLVGMLILMSLLFALMKSYNDRPEGLSGVTWNNLGSLFMRGVGRNLLLAIMSFVVLILSGVLLGLFGSISEYTLIVYIPVLFAFLVALSLWGPVYLFEDKGIFGAFGRSLRLGFATWGGIFAIVLVVTLISIVLGLVVSVPWAVLVGVKQIFLASGESVEGPSLGYDIAVYLMGVLLIFFNYLVYAFMAIALMYQYAHAAKKCSQVSVEEDVESFEQH